MLNKPKQLFKLMKYEFIRLSRNTLVFSLLMAFSIILLVVLSFVQSNSKEYPISVFTNGVNIEETQAIELINKNLKTDNIVYVNSREEGIYSVKSNQTVFFICVNDAEEGDQVTFDFYYNESSAIASPTISNLHDAKNEYSYREMNKFLEKYGITLNKTYFELIDFKPASGKRVSIMQNTFAIELTCCASIILMLGLAYSLSRDNETNVSQNIAYIPVGPNNYLLSKAIPYVLLGILEMAIMYLLGILLFNIEFQINVFLALLLSVFFITALISLAMLFGLLKSQIATIFLDMLVVLLPIFISIMTHIQSCPLVMQILIHCLPITPFISFLNCMMFNGVILWWYIPLFILQTVVYYLIALLILKRRISS